MRYSRKHLFRGIGVLALIGSLLAIWWTWHEFFPGSPHHIGIIEDISPRDGGGYTLAVRERPMPTWETAATSDEQRRSARFEGIIRIHVRPITVVRGLRANVPQVGQQVKVWTDGLVLLSFPGQANAKVIEFELVRE
jgi:hypothetical protein